MKISSEIFFPEQSFINQLVKCVWRIYDQDTAKRCETILPKGNAEIIFNMCGNIFYRNTTEKTINIFPRVAINGINSAPFILEKEGEQLFIGVQLNICALRCLFRISPKEMTNRVIDGSLICKELDDLWYQISNAGSFNDQSVLIMKWVHQKLGHSDQINYPLPNFHSTMQINSTKAICCQFDYSERHVRRIFNDWLGMNIESFIQYKKYLKALYLIHQTNLTLTQIAHDSGYYDQSHFIREFKSYTNLTPKEYRQKKSTTPGHIYCFS